MKLIQIRKNLCEQIETESTVDRNSITYEHNGVRNKALSLNEYLEIIRLYLKNALENVKRHDAWKIQLSVKFLFRSLKDVNENLD